MKIRPPHLLPSGKQTVCYGKWPFIVDIPIQNGGSFHSYVAVYQRVYQSGHLRNILTARLDMLDPSIFASRKAAAIMTPGRRYSPLRGFAAKDISLFLVERSHPWRGESEPGSCFFQWPLGDVGDVGDVDQGEKSSDL